MKKKFPHVKLSDTIDGLIEPLYALRRGHPYQRFNPRVTFASTDKQEALIWANEQLQEMFPERYENG